MLNWIEKSKDNHVSLVERDFSKCFRFFPRPTTTTRGWGVGYKAEQRERQVRLLAKWSSRGDGTTERSRRERHEWHMERWQLFSLPLCSSSSELSRRISLLSTYPSGISPVELVSLDLGEDPFSRSKKYLCTCCDFSTILRRTSYNYSMIYCFTKSRYVHCRWTFCNANELYKSHKYCQS